MTKRNCDTSLLQSCCSSIWCSQIRISCTWCCCCLLLLLLLPVVDNSNNFWRRTKNNGKGHAPTPSVFAIFCDIFVFCCRGVVTVFSAPGGVCFFLKFVPRGYFFLFLNLHPGVIFFKKLCSFSPPRGWLSLDFQWSCCRSWAGGLHLHSNECNAAVAVAYGDLRHVRCHI